MAEQITRKNKIQRVLTLSAGLVLIVFPLLARPTPITEEPPDVPPEYRFDFISTFASIVTEVPISPHGKGSAIAYSRLGNKAGAYKATEEFVPRDPAMGFVGRELVPKAGRFLVPHLTPRTGSTVIQGMGALGVNLQAPRRVRVRNDDGSMTRVPVIGKGSSASTGVGEATSNADGILAFGLGTWLSGKDNDPPAPGNKSALANFGVTLIGRSENGPKKTAEVASLSEQKITRLPRGNTELSPIIIADLVTTLGLEELPKPGRSANVILAFGGFASFTPDPLWSLILEYTTDGLLLSQFTSSAFLRQLDDPSKPLEDDEILSAVRDEINVDDDGNLDTHGLVSIWDYSLFDGVVQSRAPWDYTQKLASYSILTVPEPGTLALFGISLGALGYFRRGKMRSRR